MEKGNIVPIHKKGDKKTLKNYCPVSLLTICGKIFEKLMFNYFLMFNLLYSTSPENNGAISLETFFGENQNRPSLKDHPV